MRVFVDTVRLHYRTDPTPQFKIAYFL